MSCCVISLKKTKLKLEAHAHTTFERIHLWFLFLVCYSYFNIFWGGIFMTYQFGNMTKVVTFQEKLQNCMQRGESHIIHLVICWNSHKFVPGAHHTTSWPLSIASIYCKFTVSQCILQAAFTPNTTTSLHSKWMGRRDLKLCRVSSSRATATRIVKRKSLHIVSWQVLTVVARVG